MNIEVNGQAKDIDQSMTLGELLETLGYAGQLVAVAVNRNCVRRSELAHTSIKTGDSIEILAPMAGG